MVALAAELGCAVDSRRVCVCVFGWCVCVRAVAWHHQSATDRGVTNGYMLLNVEKGSTVCRGTFCMNPLTRVTWAGFTSYNVRWCVVVVMRACNGSLLAVPFSRALTLLVLGSFFFSSVVPRRSYCLIPTPCCMPSRLGLVLGGNSPPSLSLVVQVGEGLVSVSTRRCCCCWCARVRVCACARVRMASGFHAHVCCVCVCVCVCARSPSTIHQANRVCGRSTCKSRGCSL